MVIEINGNFEFGPFSIQIVAEIGLVPPSLNVQIAFVLMREAIGEPMREAQVW